MSWKANGLYCLRRHPLRFPSNSWSDASDESAADCCKCATVAAVVNVAVAGAPAVAAAAGEVRTNSDYVGSLGCW